MLYFDTKAFFEVFTINPDPIDEIEKVRQIMQAEAKDVIW